MKVAILFRSQTEHERQVLEFEREYQYRTGRPLTTYDINTKEGWDLASLYDVVQYPAVIATANNGQLLQMWQGEMLPLVNEVMYYDRNE